MSGDDEEEEEDDDLQPPSPKPHQKKRRTEINPLPDDEVRGVGVVCVCGWCNVVLVWLLLM